jgi:hypothetical protein
MSFSPVTTNEITTGEPVTNATQTKIKNNFDDHEARILAVETGSSAVYPPIIMRWGGEYTGRTIQNLLRTTLNFNLTITGIRLLIDGCGTSGTTEVGLSWKRGVGSWTSICTTNPSVAFSAGDDSISSNTVLNASNVDLQAGDLLRLDVISTQVNGSGFLVRIDYNKT